MIFASFHYHVCPNCKDDWEVDDFWCVGDCTGIDALCETCEDEQTALIRKATSERATLHRTQRKARHLAAHLAVLSGE